MPLCRNQIGGYTFPKDNASRKRWVTAVKRVSGNNKPWSPKQRRLPLISPSVAVMLIQNFLNRGGGVTPLAAPLLKLITNVLRWASEQSAMLLT